MRKECQVLASISSSEKIKETTSNVERRIFELEGKNDSKKDGIEKEKKITTKFWTQCLRIMIELIKEYAILGSYYAPQHKNTFKRFFKCCAII